MDIVYAAMQPHIKFVDKLNSKKIRNTLKWTASLGCSVLASAQRRIMALPRIHKVDREQTLTIPRPGYPDYFHERFR